MKNNIKIILPEGDGKQKPIPINEDAPGPKPKSTPEPIKKNRFEISDNFKNKIH